MRTLIIDDERLARKELASLLAKHSQVEVIGECANADEAIPMIASERPDLIFLDIQMPGKTGFELLESLEYVPRVIFVTAYDDYAIKAFEVNALDYLLKPVEEHRLEEAIKRVQVAPPHDPSEVVMPQGGPESRLSLNDQVFLKDGEKCWFITLRDVRMFESEGNYVRVYFDTFKPLVLKSLNNLEKRLDEREFFRINRKFIVNLREIAYVEPWFNGGLQIKLHNGTQLEVSRRQAARFKDLMSL
jgi:two-component system LytT family response regulator